MPRSKLLEHNATISESEICVDELLLCKDFLVFLTDECGVHSYWATGEKNWHIEDAKTMYCLVADDDLCMVGWSLVCPDKGIVLFDLSDYFGVPVSDEDYSVGEYKDNVNVFSSLNYFYRGIDIEKPEKGFIRLSKIDYSVRVIEESFCYAVHSVSDSFVLIGRDDLSYTLDGGEKKQWSRGIEDIFEGDEVIWRCAANEAYVLLSGDRGNIKVLCVKTGETLNSLNLGLHHINVSLESCFAIISGETNGKSEIFCFDIQRDLILWNKQDTGSVFSVANGSVYTVIGDKKPIAIDIISGDICWSHDDLHSTNHIVCNSKHVVYSYCMAEMLIFDIVDGENVTT